MTTPTDIRAARLSQDRSKELAEKGFYHSFELPDGTLIEGVNSLPRLRERYAHFPIPSDLRGKRVLDIGAWDGFFTFEAERHGAAVTAIDCVEVEHFLELHRRLGSQADYRILEVYEMAQAGLGTFDIVFFLGVLYHLRHPLLALEMVCGLTTEVAIVESFVTDGDTWRDHADAIPTMEFYERYELANQFDNWVGPSVTCLLALCRAAGFARVELLRSESNNAQVACYRKWEPPPSQPSAEPPQLVSVVEALTLGVNFYSGKEQYVQCWFHTARPAIMPEDLKLEIDGLGAAAHCCVPVGTGRWTANFPLPRGLRPGWRAARLRFADSAFSDTVRIATDIPVTVSRLDCVDVHDGVSWKQDEVAVNGEGYLVTWLTGLPENRDCHNVRLMLGERRLRIHFIGEPDAQGVTQVNAAVPRDFSKGEHSLRIECGGVRTPDRRVRVT